MDDIITLDYGSGGKKTSDLINELILPSLSNSALLKLSDGAVVDGFDKLVFSTDSFVVYPHFFAGGDIGKLSVCGTVNDISMAGGIPKYLSLSFIIEEGFKTADLKRIISSVSETAAKAGVLVVTGDTKVVEHGKADGIYINTSGIGTLACNNLSEANIKEGDAVIVSGTIGDHGMAIMLARNDKLLEGEICSDCAPLNHLAEKLYALGDALRVLRDPTRGGVATTLCEFVEKSELSIELDENAIPVKPSVLTACNILGLDPLYLANEGKLLCIVDSACAYKALSVIKENEYGADATIIGRVTSKVKGKVYVKGEFGTRIISKLSGDALPRIC